MDNLILGLAMLRWYVRYTAAACVFLVSWWMFKNGAYGIPLILTLCALPLIKEIIPSSLLIAGSIWVWPHSFFDVSFARMTFGILLQFVGSIALFIAGIIAGFYVYIAKVNAQYEEGKNNSAAQPIAAGNTKERIAKGYDK